MSNHARRVLVGAVTVKDVQNIRRNTMIDFQEKHIFRKLAKGKKMQIKPG